MTQKIMILPDLQVPYQDTAYVKRLLRVVRVWKPDTIVQVGDLIDLPEVSQWTKNLAGEYAGTLQRSMHTAQELLRTFRDAAPQARLRVKEGNHDLRFEKYMRTYAPAASGLDSNTLPYQLNMAEIGIEYERKPFLVAPGVTVAHGHEKAYSSIPGKYELARIQEYGTSLITGHTHTPVLVTNTVGTGENARHFFGMNVGHAMDVNQVGYVADGYTKWCQGFGMLEVYGDSVHPRLVTAPSGHFSWQGKEY
jgi:metallophosphoesterase superfamily enzyme